MGTLVDASQLFASRRQNAASVEVLCGFAMLQVTRNFDYFKPVERAVRAMLRHPCFPAVRVDKESILWTTDLLDSISPESRDMAFSVSLARLRQVCGGWNPMVSAVGTLAQNDGEAALLLRSAMGAAALLWQVAEYPDHVITTLEEFHSTFSQAGPP